MTIKKGEIVDGGFVPPGPPKDQIDKGFVPPSPPKRPAKEPSQGKK